MARKKRTLPRKAKIKAAERFRRYRQSIMDNTLHRGGKNVGAPAKDGTTGLQQWLMYREGWKWEYGPTYLKTARRDYREGRLK